MIRRIALVGMLVGLLVGWLAGPGCYNTPEPACGFFCGTGNACPDDYTCNTSDNRCHLNGSPAMRCPGPDAGPIDAPDAPGEAGNAAPTVVSTVPVPNTMGVSVTTEISAVLSEDVTNVNAGTFTLVTGSTPVPGTVFYSAAADTATFTPSVQLSASTMYTASLSSGITDLQGAPLVSHSWSFTTGADTVAPIVTLQTPAPASTDVPVSSIVTAVFDEPVVNVSATTFTLVDGATPISGTVTYAAASRTATFTPATSLPTNTILTATLTGAITDVAGNPLSFAPVTWQFTTATDTTAPTVTIHSPANAATNVPITSLVRATFSERVVNVSGSTFTVSTAGGPVTGTVAYDIPTRVATFTPSADLPYDTDVTAMLTSAITDVTGNPLAADSWTFHTAPDTQAPTVTNQMPGSGASNVPVSSVVNAHFSEQVQNVSTSTFTLAAGATPISGTVQYDTVQHVATFLPSAALPFATQLTATLTSGITDLAGNPLASAPVTWMFTTAADTTAPTVQARTPAAGATMVATSTTVAVTFSEPVMGVTTSSFTVDDGTGPVAGTLASSGGGQTWTFTPTAALAAAATVTVTLSSAITDLAANPLAPVMYTFTTQ